MLDQVIGFIRDERRPAWLVGGYVRDMLLGRPTHDLDVIVPDGGIRLARRLSDRFAGASFALDADRDVGRAIIPQPDGATLEIDVARLRAPVLLDDLALRDYTVNAMALDLSNGEGAIVDPFGGRADLERKLLRAVTEGAFVDDPLRMLRGIRMVAELGFRLDGSTHSLIQRDAHLLPSVSPERIRDELMRILVAPDGWRHLRLLRDTALLPFVLPESAAQIGVEQSHPHYQDVFDHSRSVLAHLQGLFALLHPQALHAIPAPAPKDETVIAPPSMWEEAREVLGRFAEELRRQLCLPLASGRVRRDLLCWAAVAHDWGKPARRTVEADTGKIRFFDHDHWGALVAEARLAALKFSSDEASYVARLTDLHMRPGELSHQYPFSRRAQYRFFRAADNTGPDVALLALADYMATLAKIITEQPDAVEAERWGLRLKTARDLFDAYFNHRAEQVSPPALLNGRQVMAALDIAPGPLVGELLEGLREAQAAGEVLTEEQAWAWVREQALARLA
jgi:tRNA nucleotidyltransferase/poly(A) polymerase